MAFANVKSQSPGKAASDATKSDAKLSQLGGEGRGIKVTKGSVAFSPDNGVNEAYTGPARVLKTKSF